MTREMALNYWVAHLRAALGEPVQTVIPTRQGLKAVTAIPTLDDMEFALGMSRDVMEAWMGRTGLTAWDVAVGYVGADEHSTFYSGPGRQLWAAPAGMTER